MGKDSFLILDVFTDISSSRQCLKDMLGTCLSSNFGELPSMVVCFFSVFFRMSWKAWDEKWSTRRAQVRQMPCIEALCIVFNNRSSRCHLLNWSSFLWCFSSLLQLFLPIMSKVMGTLGCHICVSAFFSTFTIFFRL